MEGEAGVCPLSVHQEARVHGGCSTHSGHSRRHDMRHHLLGQLTAFKHSGSSKQPLLSSLTSFLLSCSAHSSHTRLYLFPIDQQCSCLTLGTASLASDGFAAALVLLTPPPPLDIHSRAPSH